MILQDAGLNLPELVKPILKFRNAPVVFWEFDIRQHGRLLNGVYPTGELRFCPTCGRNSAIMPGTPLIELDSIPAGVDLFRVSNFQTLLVVTERFAEAVRTAGIKGAEFRVVDVK